MNNNLTISQSGVDLIKFFEGKHDGNLKTAIWEPKKDPVGYWTLGYGARYDINNKLVTAKSTPITAEMAETLLKRDIKIAEYYIKKWVKIPLNQNQYDALCSFVFNIGCGQFQKSRLLKAIKNGANFVQKTHFMGFVKANGRVLPGLVTRRSTEYSLYIK